jgi:hypothetical protein
MSLGLVLLNHHIIKEMVVKVEVNHHYNNLCNIVCLYKVHRVCQIWNNHW